MAGQGLNLGEGTRASPGEQKKGPAQGSKLLEVLLGWRQSQEGEGKCQEAQSLQDAQSRPTVVSAEEEIGSPHQQMLGLLWEEAASAPEGKIQT